MFYPNTSSYQHKKPSRKKAKQNQNINTTICPLLYYYCLCKSINERFLKIAPGNKFCSQKRMQNYSFSQLQPNILIENITFFLCFNILLQIKQGFSSLHIIIYKHNIRTYLLNYALPIRKKLSFIKPCTHPFFL